MIPPYSITKDLTPGGRMTLNVSRATGPRFSSLCMRRTPGGGDEGLRPACKRNSIAGEEPLVRVIVSVALRRCSSGYRATLRSWCRGSDAGRYAGRSTRRERTPIVENSLLIPIRNKYVRLAPLLRVPVRGPGQFPAVRGEHREAVEHGIIRDPLKSCAVDVYDIDLEIMAVLFYVLAPVVHVARKDEPLSVRMPRWREIGRPVVQDHLLVRAVNVHDPEIEGEGEDIVLLHAAPPLGLFCFRPGIPCAPGDLSAVRGEPRPAVVARLVRQPPHVRAVRVHDIDIEISLPLRPEHDLLAIG